MADEAEPNEPNEPNESAAPPAGENSGAALAPPAADAPKCTAAFRRKLLGRLPQLGYTAWMVKDSFALDDEWNTAVGANADAVLEPLEAVAPVRLAPPTNSRRGS